MLERLIFAMSKKCQAIALCRVSSDRQKDDGNSLERQDEFITKMADDYDAEIVKKWSISQSSKRGVNIRRKDLQEMLAFCDKHKRVKYLFVYKPDRFMRSMDEGVYFETLFKLKGVDVVFSNKELNEDTSLARLRRSIEYFTAEGSNEERIKNGTDIFMDAFNSGRYFSHPKIGYKKGHVVGIAEIDPAEGPIMQTQLIRIATRMASPTVALKDFNNARELAGIKKAPLKMDKWRDYCCDSYYCGYIEFVTKEGEHKKRRGLHEPLISEKHHDAIIEAFNKKPKYQTGPNKTGNPLYPFNKMLIHAECDCHVSKYNSFVGTTQNNGKTKKLYPKYRCRGCRMSISRDEVRDKIGEIASSIQLTERGKRALNDAIAEVFEMESGMITLEKNKLKQERKTALGDRDKLMESYISEPDSLMKATIRDKHELVCGRIKRIDARLDQLGQFEVDASIAFAKFAIDFVNKLATNILNLSPYEMQMCKQLLFPSGFCVDNNKNIYTHHFSPIYRWAETKNDSFEPKNSLLVRVKRL